MQIPREDEDDSYSHLRHYLEFTATKDIGFNEALDLTEEKQDLVDYLQNLTRNTNARLPSLSILCSFHSKLMHRSVVQLHLKWHNYKLTIMQEWTLMCRKFWINLEIGIQL